MQELGAVTLTVWPLVGQRWEGGFVVDMLDGIATRKVILYTIRKVFNIRLWTTYSDNTGKDLVKSVGDRSAIFNSDKNNKHQKSLAGNKVNSHGYLVIVFVFVHDSLKILTLIYTGDRADWLRLRLWADRESAPCIGSDGQDSSRIYM